MSLSPLPSATGPAWQEVAFAFGDTPLTRSVGVLCGPLPDNARQDIGLLILSGGAQTRWGAHRMFVNMGRHLARAGWPSMRFDWPGLGDATGAPLHFEQLAPSVAQAMRALQQQCPDLRGVILVGLCDGASVALMHAANHADGILGMVLINPWVRTDQSLAQTRLRHYYWSRLQHRGFWRKLLSGAVGWRAWRDLLGNLKASRTDNAAPVDFVTLMAQGWRQGNYPILLLTSENDATGQEFALQLSQAHAWHRKQLTHITLKGADHTCSSARNQEALLAAISDWLDAHHRRHNRPAM